jgi:hypothetical protein
MLNGISIQLPLIPFSFIRARLAIHESGLSPSLKKLAVGVGNIRPITVSKFKNRLPFKLAVLLTCAAMAEHVRGEGSESRSTVASSRLFMSGLALALSRPLSPSLAFGVGSQSSVLLSPRWLLFLPRLLVS